MVDIEGVFVAAIVVVVGDEQECWRRVSGNLVGNLTAGIDEHLEVRAAVDAVDGIGSGGVAFAWRVSDERGDGAAGGETQDADAVRVDVELGGAGADEAHGAVGILADVFWGVGRVFFAGQAVLDVYKRQASGSQGGR